MIAGKSGDLNGVVNQLVVHINGYMVDTHKVVAVIVPLLTSDSYLEFIVACISGSFEEVLRQKLSLLVKVICRTLNIKMSAVR